MCNLKTAKNLELLNISEFAAQHFHAEKCSKLRGLAIKTSALVYSVNFIYRAHYDSTFFNANDSLPIVLDSRVWVWTKIWLN